MAERECEKCCRHSDTPGSEALGGAGSYVGGTESNAGSDSSHHGHMYIGRHLVRQHLLVNHNGRLLCFHDLCC